MFNKCLNIYSGREFFDRYIRYSWNRRPCKLCTAYRFCPISYKKLRLHRPVSDLNDALLTACRTGHKKDTSNCKYKVSLFLARQEHASFYRYIFFAEITHCYRTNSLKIGTADQIKDNLNQTTTATHLFNHFVKLFERGVLPYFYHTTDLDTILYYDPDEEIVRDLNIRWYPQLLRSDCYVPILTKTYSEDEYASLPVHGSLQSFRKGDKR